MGLGPMKNGRHQAISSYAGSWAATVNKTPMPAAPTRTALAIGRCDRDGSNYQAYDEPIERPLWNGGYLI